MATAARTGRTAYLYLSTASSAGTSAQTKVADLTDYTLTADRPTIDVTNHDSSGYTESLPGIFKATWEAKLNYVSTSIQGKVRTNVVAATPAPFGVSFLLTTSLTAKKLTGVTRITGFTQSNATNDAVLGTIKGEITGKLTRTS